MVAERGREIVEQAPAKINLSLHVLGRRMDGYHELESLVVFADLADTLTLLPGAPPSLVVMGPTATASGPVTDNLVLKAAGALTTRRRGLLAGSFMLDKKLPVAAGIGGGSADAAAALRLLARANDLSRDDQDLRDAARTVGADVPVCLESLARMMRGAGEILGPPLSLPPLPALLVNPGVVVETAAVFRAMGLKPGEGRAVAPHPDLPADVTADGLILLLEECRNDLEPATRQVQPVVIDVIERLRRKAGCRLARMSGSGATCFGLFETMDQAVAAAVSLRKARPTWWIQPATLGSARRDGQ